MRKIPQLRRSAKSVDGLTACRTIALSLLLIVCLVVAVLFWLLLILITAAIHPILTVVVVWTPFSIVAWYGLPKRKRCPVTRSRQRMTRIARADWMAAMRREDDR